MRIIFAYLVYNRFERRAEMDWQIVKIGLTIIFVLAFVLIMVSWSPRPVWTLLALIAPVAVIATAVLIVWGKPEDETRTVHIWWPTEAHTIDTDALTQIQQKKVVVDVAFSQFQSMGLSSPKILAGPLSVTYLASPGLANSGVDFYRSRVEIMNLRGDLHRVEDYQVDQDRQLITVKLVPEYAGPIVLWSLTAPLLLLFSISTKRKEPDSAPATVQSGS